MRTNKPLRKAKLKATPKRTPKTKLKLRRKKKVAQADPNELFRRIHRELIDDFDEELEMEREDWEITESGGAAKPIASDADAKDRRQYFTELYRLQGELVKLHDWVVETGHRLVIVFEGRDAAGKGGVIKRIAQRLNPRVCRVAALPAPTDREKTQWYFQRYICLLYTSPSPRDGLLSRMPSSA